MIVNMQMTEQGIKKKTDIQGEKESWLFILLLCLSVVKVHRSSLGPLCKELSTS